MLWVCVYCVTCGRPVKKTAQISQRVTGPRFRVNSISLSTNQSAGKLIIYQSQARKQINRTTVRDWTRGSARRLTCKSENTRNQFFLIWQDIALSLSEHSKILTQTRNVQVSTTSHTHTLIFSHNYLIVIHHQEK